MASDFHAITSLWTVISGTKSYYLAFYCRSTICHSKSIIVLCPNWQHGDLGVQCILRHVSMRGLYNESTSYTWANIFHIWFKIYAIHLWLKTFTLYLQFYEKEARNRTVRKTCLLGYRSSMKTAQLDINSLVLPWRSITNPHKDFTSDP
jgi:hypothetical protein